jgi:polyphosphate kinase
LADSRIHIARHGSLDANQKLELDRYFRERIYPVLTPLAFDRGRPLPHISNLSLNLAVVVRDHSGAEHFARVKVPDSIPQLVPVEEASYRSTFLWLEELIVANLALLFPGLEIVGAHPFHVTRDAEMSIQEIETDDLLATIEEAVWRRRFRDVVRLLVDQSMPEALLEILTSNLEIERADVYRVRGPLNLARLRQITSLSRPDLKDRPFQPAIPPALVAKDRDFFAAIQADDILLHHPFDSFQPVVDFLQSAARDPHVLAIKMTLYRLGRNSPIVDALLESVKNGKQVAAVVELQARFDEESNIEWARTLERQGVHVVYGLPGLKVHSKVALVVRREGTAIRRYLHLATGNYNPTTAQLYTDFGMFTCDPGIGADATALFNYLTGYSAGQRFRKLLVAPVNLRRRLAEMIRREMEHRRGGRQARLIFKMNALDDPAMMRLLCDASRAGVTVDLVVRGINCLRPGVQGLSDKIRVRSIVGRFLEHSRAYYFENGGAAEIYMGSADLMPRNLDRRVEVLFPVTSPRGISRLREILDQYLADDSSARDMRNDGGYSPKPRGLGKLDSQSWLLAQRSGKPDAGLKPETRPIAWASPSQALRSRAAVQELDFRQAADRLAVELQVLRELFASRSDPNRAKSTL